MKILAVDTALGACSVAVLDGDLVRAHRFEQMERGHAEALAPMVQDAMREAALDCGELQRLAVTTGPGTFTGQRVGLAFMRGLRLALKKPLIGITTLDAMAAAAMKEMDAKVGIALHDAKRGEVYLGMRAGQQTVIAPTLLPFGDALAATQQALDDDANLLAMAGTAGLAACEYFRSRGRVAQVTSVLQPDAIWVARLAVAAVDSNVPPRPLYLRPPDARLPVQEA